MLFKLQAEEIENFLLYYIEKWTVGPPHINV